jgi:molybdopterin/thiamine biosynthesis adenylyltransferase
MKGVPRLSSIDEAASLKNADYICKNMAPPASQGMVVFNQEMTSHDAVIYDRSLQGFRTMDTLDIVGRPTEVRLVGASPAPRGDLPIYSRQLLVPGWKQDNIARQRIVIVGAGGNGAQLLQMLTCIGAGTEGWIAVCDPDIIEASNQPRIPYSMPEHVGHPKVTVAAQYVGRKNPTVKFYPYPCSVTEKAVQVRLKGATVIVGCGDHDGVRKVCNELAVRYHIPYIDLGCEIHTGDQKVQAVGQVRLVLPGDNACLVCCGGYDPSAAAEELMDDASAVVHASRGYIRGSREQSTASVTVLNATTAQTALTAFLGLTLGEEFGKWDFVHFDLFQARTIPASTTRRENCPLCGDDGVLAAGDPLPETSSVEPSLVEMEAVK